jgi:hypothetical protein
MNKRVAITLLAGVNLVLLALLLSPVLGLPSAYGQVGGRGGGWVCVTGKAAGQSYDVLYALDLASRKLHAFHPASAQGKKIVHADVRDLAADFGR